MLGTVTATCALRYRQGLGVSILPRRQIKYDHIVCTQLGEQLLLPNAGHTELTLQTQAHRSSKRIAAFEREVIKMVKDYSNILPSMIAICSKMIVFPVTTYIVSAILGLPTEITVIAVIFATCPTSPAGFPLAKQMGGNSVLMATIISIQTALAVLAIPIAISFAQMATH